MKQYHHFDSDAKLGGRMTSTMQSMEFVVTLLVLLVLLWLYVVVIVANSTVVSQDPRQRRGLIPLDSDFKPISSFGSPLYR
jgi:hypothetical protein